MSDNATKATLEVNLFQIQPFWFGLAKPKRLQTCITQDDVIVESKILDSK